MIALLPARLNFSQLPPRRSIMQDVVTAQAAVVGAERLGVGQMVQL